MSRLKRYATGLTFCGDRLFIEVPAERDHRLTAKRIKRLAKQLLPRETFDRLNISTRSIREDLERQDGQ